MKDDVSHRAETVETRLIRDGAAFLLFCTIAAIAMYPVLSAFPYTVIGWAGDNVQYIYMFGRIAQALTSGQSLIVDPSLNYPGALSLNQTDAPFLTLIALAPVTAASTPVLSYNIAIAAGHVLSGFFVYLWIARLFGSRLGGIVAGTIFLLSPYRIAHSYGHLNLVSTQFLVLFFWALDGALSRSVMRWRHLLALAGASFLVAGASSLYYFVFCLLGGAVYALLLVGLRPRLLWRGWQIGAVATAAGILGALPYLVDLGGAAYSAYSPEEIRFWSADLVDFVAPSRLHPWWGAWSATVYPRWTWVEHTLYLGVIPGALAVTALFTTSGWAGRRRWVWAGMALAGVILALGSDLHVLGRTFGGDKPVWLPAHYLVQLPLLQFMRVWSRAAVLSLLFISLLSGVGATSLMRRFARPQLVAAGLLLLIVLELWPGRWSSTLVTPRPIDKWLAEQPGDFAVGFLPPDIDNYMNIYGSLLHRKQLPAYLHPHHTPDEYHNYRSIATQFPEPSAIDDLRGLRLTYLIVRRDAFDGANAPAWADIQIQLETTPRLYTVAEVENFTIFAFAEEP
jgi:hypothetical protein